MVLGQKSVERFRKLSKILKIPHTHWFSEIKPDSDWQSCGQNDSSYHQTQPDTWNQLQQYLHGRRRQQDIFRKYYNREKVGKHGNIHSIILTPDKICNHSSIGKLFLFNKEKPNLFFWEFLKSINHQDALKTIHCQSYNQNRSNNILCLLTLNQVGFQLDFIILLQFILNQPHTRRGPAQDVTFFYTPSHLNELQSCKSSISTNISGIFIFN